MGFILVFYGDGKGKTTAAIGLAVRSAGHGKRVLFMQFIKRDLQVGEYKLLKMISNIKHVALGPGLGADKQAILQASRKGLEIVREEYHKYDIVILDELGVVAVKYDYPVSEILDLVLEIRDNDRNVVITGKYMPREIIDIADLVTEFKCVRHYYQKVGKPIPGLDF